MKEIDHQQAQTRCPLCGGDNQCAMASGRSGGPCWCQDAVMDSAALARATAIDGGRSCLCPACGRKTGETLER